MNAFAPYYLWPALFCASFAAMLALIPLARHLALAGGFVDQPGGRKRHEGAVPPVGGLVIFPVFMVLAAFFVEGWTQYAFFYGALALLVATGAVDDRRALPARVKFLIQFLAAIMIVVPGGAQVVSMGDLFGFGPFGLRYFSIPFSVIAVVLLINAINLLDGLDGLAGGTALIALGGLALCCAGAGAHADFAQLLILCGALAGFLWFNMRHPWRDKASVFMGDAGSLALGLVIAWYAIRLTQDGGTGEHAVIQPVSVAWLLALPIMDTCGQFARRVAGGRHPFSPDHNHFHHHFITAGLPVSKATAMILLNVLIHGSIGVGAVMAGVPGYLLMYVWIALLGAHIYMSMRPHRFRRLIQRYLVRGPVND